MAASARCAPEPRVLLGLRDAAIPDPGRDSLQPPSWATSALGGSPNCAPSVTMTYPSCGICGTTLMHIVQIYCPLEGSLFHRVINVFACAMKGCWGKSESWKVLRSQYLQMQGKEMQVIPALICNLKQENNFATKDWCDGADDWGICDETEYPVQTTSHLLGLNTNFPSESVSVVADEYLGDTDDPAELRDRFQDLMGDILFVIPALQVSKYHRDSGAPLYFYEFQHRPSTFKDSKPDFVKADHGDEVGFVFGGPFLRGDSVIVANATEEEKHLSRTIMKYWANFARNGNPNGKGLVEWPLYDLNDQYLELNLKQKKAEKLKGNRVEFWTKIFPEKVKEITEEKKEHSEL